MFYQRYKNGYKVQLKVIPNSSKNEICGVVGGDFGAKLLRIKIAAVPDKNKANKELIKFLAKQWGVRSSDIEILSGDTSRKKVLYIEGDLEKKLTLLDSGRL